LCDWQSLGNHYREEFANREKLTEEKVDEFVESFLGELKTGKGPGGWPNRGWSPSYCISKMAVNGYMSVLAREMSSKSEPQVYVNSFAPGYTGTGMTGGKGHTVEEGAMTGVWLALHPPEGFPQGKFWAEKCRGEMPF
jgi:carbonyl reductase 1